MDTALNDNKTQYVFIQEYRAEYADNAPTVKVGSILRQCKDTWWQIFSPDGSIRTGRVSQKFIEANEGILIQQKQDTATYNIINREVIIKECFDKLYQQHTSHTWLTFKDQSSEYKKIGDIFDIIIAKTQH